MDAEWTLSMLYRVAMPSLRNASSKYAQKAQIVYFVHFNYYDQYTLKKESTVMESINSTDAKKSFSDVVLKVQQAPVWITRHDKPVAVVMSAKEFQEIQALKEKVLVKFPNGLSAVRLMITSPSPSAINSAQAFKPNISGVHLFTARKSNP